SATSIWMRLLVAPAFIDWPLIGAAVRMRGLGSRSAPSMVNVVVLPDCKPRGETLVICGAAAAFAPDNRTTARVVLRAIVTLPNRRAEWFRIIPLLAVFRYRGIRTLYTPDKADEATSNERSGRPS